MIQIGKKSFHFLVAECQRTWKSLRDRFTKERNKMRSGSEAHESWVHFNAMLFYSKFSKPRKYLLIILSIIYIINTKFLLSFLEHIQTRNHHLKLFQLKNSQVYPLVLTQSGQRKRPSFHQCQLATR